MRKPDKPRVCQRPGAEIVHPDFAVNIVYLMVVQNVLRLHEAACHHALSLRQDGCNVRTACLRQSERAIEWEGQRPAIARGERLA